MKWTEELVSKLTQFYPQKGKQWCVENLGLTEAQVRQKASRLGLKQDKNSDFHKDWVRRASQSKIGKKRPERANVIKKLHKEGKLKMTEEGKRQLSIKIKKRLSEKGHPRGALGLKHTDKAKGIISAKAKKMWEEMPENIRDQYSKRASILGTKSSPLNRASASWKAGWREIGGYNKYYRSRWEANYARYLQWLKEKGEIKDWRHESKTFWFEGIKRGCMSYLPDFEVVENDGSVVYHEVKGWMDDRSKTKIKRMAKYHPEVKLIVIDSKQYKIVEKKIKSFISGWE